MKNRYVPVEPKTFHSWLIPVATVLYGIAALCGLSGSVSMLMPGSLDALVEDLIAGGITEASAIRTWKLIHVILTLVAFAAPSVLTVGYGFAVCKQPGKGLVMLCDVFEWVLKILKIVVKVLLAVLVYRIIRYAVQVMPKDEGMYLMYAMLVSEALMLIVAGTLYVLLCHFLDRLCDSASGIADTLENHRLSGRSIPKYAATGFLLFGLLALFFGLDRMFTMVIVQEYRSSHYAFLMAEHPLLILSGASLVCGALGNLLSAFYLYGFKRKSEKIYHANKEKLR